VQGLPGAMQPIFNHMPAQGIALNIAGGSSLGLIDS
jgi:hypothetical protein